MKITRTDEIGEMHSTTVLEDFSLNDLSEILDTLDGKIVDDMGLDSASRLIINLPEHDHLGQLHKYAMVEYYRVGDNFEVDVPFLQLGGTGFGLVRRVALWDNVDLSENMAIIKFSGGMTKVKLPVMRNLKVGEVLRLHFS